MAQHRFRLLEGRLQTAREQDYGHREMAYGFRHFIIFEFKPKAVGSNSHTQKQEEEQ